MLYAAGYLATLTAFLLTIFLTGWVFERTFLRLKSLQGLVRLCLGFAFWTAGAFVLATFGWLRLGGLLVWGGIVGAIGFVGWRRRALMGHGGVSIGLERLDLLLISASSLILLPFLALAMSPPVSWDANVYHLALPRVFVEGGGFEAPDFSVYAHWPLNTELLFAIALLVKDHVLAKLVHCAFGLLTLWVLFRAGRERFGIACGGLAALLFLANPVVAFEMRVAYVELAQAFFTLAAFLFLERALDRGREPETAAVPNATTVVENRALISPENRMHVWLWLSGLCCGLVAGTKVTGIWLAVALVTVYLSSRWGDRRAGWMSEIGTLTRHFLSPVLILWLPWIVKTWWATGNPVYPLLYGVFGGTDWTPELSTRFATWQSAIGMGREPIDYLFLPLRVIFAGGQGYERFDGQLGMFWILALPLALVAARRRADVRRLLAASALLFAFWALTSQQMRFLVPALPLLALASAISACDLLAAWRAPMRRVITLLLLLAALGLNGWMHQRLIGAGYKSLALYGTRPKAELLASAVHPIYRTIDEKLPADARLLLLNTNHTFFLERPYIVDSFFEASQIDAWLKPAGSVDALLSLLRERGITHLLIEQRERGVAYPGSLRQVLDDPARVEVVERSGDGRFILLALRPSIG